MPVNGFKHPRVVQYAFRPQPYAVLDRGFNGHDWQWEHDVVEKLRRGESAPRGQSLTDLHERNSSYGDPPGGWKQAEEWARNANRTNAVFLNDEAIARRRPEREAREKAYVKYLEEQSVRMREILARAAEKKQELERVRAEEVRKAMRRQEEKARREKEWRNSYRNERDAILAQKWQCKCGTIASIAWDSDKSLFMTWCPVCHDVKFIEQHKLAARL